MSKYKTITYYNNNVRNEITKYNNGNTIIKKYYENNGTLRLMNSNILTTCSNVENLFKLNCIYTGITTNLFKSNNYPILSDIVTVSTPNKYITDNNIKWYFIKYPYVDIGRWINNTNLSFNISINNNIQQQMYICIIDNQNKQKTKWLNCNIGSSYQNILLNSNGEGDYNGILPSPFNYNTYNLIGLQSNNVNIIFAFGVNINQTFDTNKILLFS